MQALSAAYFATLAKLGTRAEFPPLQLQNQYSPRAMGATVHGKLASQGGAVVRYLPRSKNLRWVAILAVGDVRRALGPAGDAGMLGMLVDGAPLRAASTRPGGQLCGGRQLPGGLEASRPCRELRLLSRATEHQCIDTGSEHRAKRAGSTHARHWVPRGT